MRSYLERRRNSGTRNMLWKARVQSDRRKIAEASRINPLQDEINSDIPKDIFLFRNNNYAIDIPYQSNEPQPLTPTHISTGEDIFVNSQRKVLEEV